MAGHILEATARRHGQRPAIVDGEVRLTYTALRDRVRRLANALLGLGLHPGDRVLDLQRNAYTYIETDLATTSAGLVRVPLNYRLAPADWAYIAADSGARALVHSADFAAEAAALAAEVDTIAIIVGVGGGPGHDYEGLLGEAHATALPSTVAPEQLVSLNYSSGTTGRPKGCMRTARNRMVSVFDTLVSLFDGALGPDDVWLHAGPITHASGLFVMPHVAVGATQVILRAFDEGEVLALLEAHRVTGTVLVPTMVERVIAEPTLPRRDLAALRHVTYAGAPMAAERIVAANEALGGRLTQFYGMVEAIPPVTVLTQSDHRDAQHGERPHRLGSAGRAVLGAVVEVVDEAGQPAAPDADGELVIAGDHVMAGYWGLDEATGKTIVDGRLHTGDMARMDEDGYVTIIDRKGDMIISGGYNVYPREVEDVLAIDPAVAEVAVIGVPDPMWGQAVTAYVVPRPGHHVDEAELLARCAPRLASYKKPKRVVIVAELPKGSTGKIARKALREQVYEGAERMI